MRDAVRVRIDAGLGGLELIEAVHTTPRFPRHAHATYALGVVSWGVNRFRYRGGLHEARPGALCTVTPGEAHDVEPAGRVGFAYRCLYPSADLVAEVASATDGRRAPLLPPVIHDPVTAALVAAVFDAGPDLPLLAREERLLALLRRAVTRHAVEPVAEAPAPRRAREVARARDYLAAHCGENVGLARLAAAAGMRPFPLLRAFARAYGMPPHAWLVQERVHRACALLRAGGAPADVAAAVGFADQSHLTRHFKRVLGVTPGAYRRAAGAGA